ncbi:MAG: AmmeMemoRadiSam system protein B [Spirochaetia bacterium]|nr:AmmeMemoRadiSam system protein B [Spirochaetia bacterium]
MDTTASPRRMTLPHGWYPRNQTEIDSLLGEWTGDVKIRKAKAAVSPHAGWVFSGRLAALAVASLENADTVAIIGGHLAQNSPVLYAQEPSFEVPGGELEADQELFSAFKEQLRDSGIEAPEPDRYVDNCIEVLLPMVAALHKGAKLLWLRAPPRNESKELGACLARAAQQLDRRVVCLGSTDLTHYGPAYGFTPMGLGEKAERWVSGTNDKAFIDALLEMNSEAALTRALKKEAACSPGAAVAALGFGLESGASSARLLGYSTSLEFRSADSFVGYAAIAFS